MEYNENIEQLVKKSFDNFESDVSPGVWTNIQSGLNIQPLSNVGAAGNNVSAGAKITDAASKFSAVNIIGTAAAIIGIAASVIYFSSNKELANNNPVNGSKAIQSVMPASSNETEAKGFINIQNLKNPEQAVASLNKEVDNKKENSSSNKTAYLSSTNEELPVVSMEKKDAKEVIAGKNSAVETEQPVSKTQAAAAYINNNKSKNNNDLEDVPSSQEAEVASTEVPEQKRIEEYLGHITNVITPNGDGNNDVFVIEGKDLLNLKVTIIEQSTGKTIHHWNNLHGFWDAKTENGQPAKQGWYIYNIFAQPITGKPLTAQGTFYLKLK